MKKVMVIFGTRPEAIKMCPVVEALKEKNDIEVVVCVSGQHDELLHSVLTCFNVNVDIDMKIMKERQTLFDITSNILTQMDSILEKIKPDLVLVHGDTTTAFAAALSCFYKKIPVGHVEAGLRSGSMGEPYPEEFNRRAITITSDYDFAPTITAKKNLLIEGKREEHIFVVGNTVIDALKKTVRSNYKHKELELARGKRLVLMTAHRRENIGAPLYSAFIGIKKAVIDRSDVMVIYPVHPNPNVRKIANEVFDGVENIIMIEPLDVIDFHNFLARSYIVVTDSGGVQEEAPSFGVPVLVLRDKTERGEAIDSGGARLIGTNTDYVYREMSRLLSNDEEYRKMISPFNPYGDGFASKRIAEIVCNVLNDT